MNTKEIMLLGAVLALSGVLVASGVSSTALFTAPVGATALSEGWLQGHVTTTVYDKDGYITQYVQSDNIITDNGEDCAIEMLFDNDTSGGNCDSALGATGFNYIAIGPSSTAVAVGQTALIGTETARTQDADCDFTAANGGTQAGQCVLSQTFTGLTATIEESGVFDASTTGNMLARQLTGTVALTSSDTLQVDWTFTIDGSSN